MNYLTEINSFYDWLDTNTLADSDIALWHGLMHICNKAGWPRHFTVAVSVLQLKTGLKRDRVFDARKRLRDYGRIKWESRKGNQSAIYEMIFFASGTATQLPTQRNTVSDIATQVPTQLPTQTPTQFPTQLPTINKLKKTKLNETNNISDYTTNTLLVDAIQNFIDMRKSIKKPLTDNALKLMLDKLNTLSTTDEEKIAILNQSTMSCWQGIFPLKEPLLKQAPVNQPPPPPQNKKHSETHPPAEVIWLEVEEAISKGKETMWSLPMYGVIVNRLGFDNLCQMDITEAKRQFCALYTDTLERLDRRG